MIWTRLLWRDFRFHPVQWLLAIFGIAIGVGGWIGMEGATTKASTAFRQSIETTLGRATHVVENRVGLLSEEVYFDLANGYPGKLTPIIETYGEVRRSQGAKRSKAGYVRVLGIDPLTYASFQEGGSPSNVSLNEFLSGERVMVMSGDFRSDFESGESVRVTVKGISKSVRVQGFIKDRSIRRTIFMDIGQVQERFKLNGGLSRILLREPGAQLKALRNQLDGKSVILATGERTQSVRSLLSSFQANLRALSFLSLFVGGFLVYSTMYLYALRQIHLISLLRTIGVGQSGICILLFGGLAIVSVVGSMTGVLIGGVLSGPLGSMVSGTVDQLYVPLFSEGESNTPLRMVGGFFLGLATSFVGGFKPIWDRLGVAPRAWEGVGIERRQVRFRETGLLGLGLMAWLVAPLIIVVQGGLNAGFAGCFLIALGGSVMSPFFLVVISRIPFRGIWSRMAVRNLHGYRSWTAVMVSVLVAAFSLVLSVLIMVDSFRSAVNEWVESVVKADFYVRAVPAGDVGKVVPLRSEFLGALRELDGIDSVGAVAEKKVLMSDGNPITLRGIEPEVWRGHLAFQFNAMEGDPWATLSSGGIWLSQPGSSRIGKSAGEPLLLPVQGGGHVSVTIGAVYNDYSTEWAVGYIGLERMRELYSEVPVSSAAVFTDDRAVESQLESLTRQYGYYLDSQRGLKSQALAAFDRTFAVTDVMGLVASVVAGVGLLVLLIAFTRSRSWIFGRMAAAGASRAQLIGLIIRESLLISLGAVIVAIPTGMYLSYMLITVINKRAFGWLIPFQVNLMPLLTLVGLIVLTLLAATFFPVYRLLTVPLNQLLQEGRR